MIATEEMALIASDPYRFGITHGWLCPEARAMESDITAEIRARSKDVVVFDGEFRRGVEDAEHGIGFWVNRKGVTHYRKVAKQ